MTNLADSNGHYLSHEESCNFMNNYLTSFGENLGNEFVHEPSATQYIFYHYNRPQLAYEYVISRDDVLRVLRELDGSKGSGLDYLPSFILIDTFLSIPTQIAYIICLTGP